jgi:hypothetical protein
MKRYNFKKGVWHYYPKRWFLVGDDNKARAHSIETARKIINELKKKGFKAKKELIYGNYFIYFSFRSKADEAYFIVRVEEGIKI